MIEICFIGSASQRWTLIHMMWDIHFASLPIKQSQLKSNVLGDTLKYRR